MMIACGTLSNMLGRRWSEASNGNTERRVSHCDGFGRWCSDIKLILKAYHTLSLGCAKVSDINRSLVVHESYYWSQL